MHSVNSSPTATPELSAPSTVDDKYVPVGESVAYVTWNEVTATNSDGQSVTCWDSVGGGNVALTGGNFGVGLHRVTCSVTDDSNSTFTGSFTFNVTGK